MTQINLESFRVTVTEKDIKKAQRNDSMRCVVVQAIARTVPGAHNINVDTQTCRFSVGDERFIYLTPDQVAGYVIDFDAGDPVQSGWRFGLRNPQRMAKTVRSASAKAAQAANWRKRKGLPPKEDPNLPTSLTPDGNVSEEGGTTVTPGIKRRQVFGGARSPWGSQSGRRMYGGRLLRYNRDLAAGIINPDGSKKEEVAAPSEG